MGRAQPEGQMAAAPKKKTHRKAGLLRRATKEDSTPRKKKAEATASEAEHGGYHMERGMHNFGVQPQGNMLLNGVKENARDTGLGALNILSDELVLDVLSLLKAGDLARLCLVSKGFYIFAHHEELWRNLVLESCGGHLSFHPGGWKQTYQSQAVRKEASPQNGLYKALTIRNFYSDYLFQSWLCASIGMKEEWLVHSNVPRRDDLSLKDFIHDFEEPNRPVLITGVVEQWPAFKKWSREYLLKAGAEQRFACGPVNLTFPEYYAYADNAVEERPLYLFDSKFGEKAPTLPADYEVPVYFQEDLFSLLGAKRPDYRWLIVGPARSGSSWHVDPNSTSAWNAVIRGRKKWILYPPGTTPPGIFPSSDGADVAAPVSIAEWYMNFYEATKAGDVRPLECICEEGEVLFVPRGWWHTVVNLEESVAVTQNYVSRRNLLQVLEFLSRPNASQLVSGTAERESLHQTFKEAFETQFPGELQKLQQQAAEKKAEKEKHRSFWDSVTDVKAPAFNFSFGNGGPPLTETTSQANGSAPFKFSFG